MKVNVCRESEVWKSSSSKLNVGSSSIPYEERETERENKEKTPDNINIIPNVEAKQANMSKLSVPGETNKEKVLPNNVQIKDLVPQRTNGHVSSNLVSNPSERIGNGQYRRVVSSGKMNVVVRIDDSARLRKGRGKTKGKGLEKMKKAMGSKMKIEILIGKGRPIKPIQSAKLPNELGIIARNFLLLLNKWKELTREDKDAALIRCQGEKEHEDVEPDRIEFYKHLITQNNMKDLKDLYTSGESSMTIDEIVDVVLSTKSGYIKGIGYGPKPNTTRATQRRTTELEDSLKKAKQEAASAQNELQK
ncbi:putative myosin-2-like isoform X1 [Capsicum annuum]|nr:putative myosin-2-like isoform X1 [Capsicum annuum]